jgi:hypothetical protein
MKSRSVRRALSCAFLAASFTQPLTSDEPVGTMPRMMIIDPRAAVNCPWCGDRLLYQVTTAEAQIYACAKHGPLALRSNWHFELVTPPAPNPRRRMSVTEGAERK